MKRAIWGMPFVLGLFILGCGGGAEVETATVSGKVTMDGQPVYPAKVTFSPIGTQGVEISGRPATANTDVDGSYTIATVVVGANAVGVTLTPTDPDDEEAEDNEMNIPMAGKPSQDSYNVVSGSNQIDITLVPNT
jgi:hypothetical protein